MRGNDINNLYRNITLHLNDNNGNMWWRFSEDCADHLYVDKLSKLPYSDCKENNIIYTFNDKLYPSSLSPFIGGG